MKKLLVLALSALMILSFAAVSMAAITVGGELNFGWQFSSGDQNNADFADAKVTVTADLTDSVKGFVAIKNDNSYAGSVYNGDIDFTKQEDNSSVTKGTFIDEAWVRLTQGWGNVTVGFYEFTTDSDVDIIDSYSKNIKNHAGVDVTGKITDALSVTGYIAGIDDPTTDALGKEETDLGYIYAAGLSYDTDSWGAQVIAEASSIDDTTSYTWVNAYYKLPIVNSKFYVTYMDADKGKGSMADSYAGYTKKGDAPATYLYDGGLCIVGYSFDGEKFYGRFEYEAVQLDKEDKAKLDASYGVRLGYKITDGTKLQYQMKSIESCDAYQEVKLNFCF
jgi:hypothetical protein